MSLRHPGQPLSAADVRHRLLEACARAGGQRPWGRLHGISDSHVSDCLRGHRRPGPTVLAALGLRRADDAFHTTAEPTDE